MSKNTNKPSERHYRRWQLAKGSSITSVIRGIDEDETRICWVGEDDYLRLNEDYDAATKATFDAIRTITQLREENAALKAEVKRLTDALNNLTNTPSNADGVDVKVNFWTNGGTRLPSSFQTFWMHDSAKEGGTK